MIKISSVVPAANKQLQRTVERHRGDTARSTFHYARVALHTAARGR
jgi:hypothetical protein